MSRYQRLFAVVAFSVLLLLALHLSGLRAQFSLEYLHQSFVDHFATGLLVFIALFALGNLAHVPGWIFLAAAVLALGRVWGSIATYAAATTSCALTFLLVRQLGSDALRGLGGHRMAKVFAQLDTHPVRSVALLRLLAQTLPALNYALAMSGLKFWHYLAGTLIGLPVPIILYALFFDEIAALMHLPRY